MNLLKNSQNSKTMILKYKKTHPSSLSILIIDTNLQSFKMIEKKRNENLYHKKNWQNKTFFTSVNDFDLFADAWGYSKY